MERHAVGEERVLLLEPGIPALYPLERLGVGRCGAHRAHELVEVGGGRGDAGVGATSAEDERGAGAAAGAGAGATSAAAGADTGAGASAAAALRASSSDAMTTRAIGGFWRGISFDSSGNERRYSSRLKRL